MLHRTTRVHVQMPVGIDPGLWIPGGEQVCAGIHEFLGDADALVELDARFFKPLAERMSIMYEPENPAAPFQWSGHQL